MSKRTFATAHEAAGHYSSLGFSVIPVPGGSKHPGREKWQEERHTEADIPRVFNGDVNIGLQNGQPSGHVVDVDLDTPEAIAAAHFFLPPTGATYGRPGKQHSHRLYRVAGVVKTQQFKGKPPDAKSATMIMELRSTGTQSLLPPSRHPSGEVYEWEGNGDPAEIEPEALLKAVRATAAAALIGMYWPDPGSGVRHDCALALAGYVGVALHAQWHGRAVLVARSMARTSGRSGA
jgi:hypothetical protein